MSKLKNWKEFKPIRGKIEDFFKVTKEAFGLDKLHKYTTESITKHIYLCSFINNYCNTRRIHEENSNATIYRKEL